MRRFPFELRRTLANVDGSNVEYNVDDFDVDDSGRFCERRKHSHHGGRQEQEKRETQR